MRVLVLVTTCLIAADVAAAEWTVISLEGTSQRRISNTRISGIWCDSLDNCLVATDNRDGGELLALKKDAITAVVADGKTITKESGLGAVDLSFMGLDVLPGRMVARVNRSSPFVSATKDYTKPGSFKAVKMGMNPDGPFTALNRQEMFGATKDGKKWLYVYKGAVWSATKAPGKTTMWKGLWSPNRRPTYPPDLDGMRRKDPSLCTTDPMVSGKPPPTGVGYVSDDLQRIILQAGAMNTRSKDKPGACVSVNGGKTFHNVAFPAGQTGDEGPRAIQCADADHCWAYNGLDYSENSVWVFYSTNASKGTKMTWTKAKLPESVPSKRVQLHRLFFADNQHLWIVGHNENRPLLLASTDGGKTWEDRSVLVFATLGSKTKLYSGFALDPKSIWIGGEKGVLMYHPDAGRE